MIARGLCYPPSGGLGIVALKIVQDYARELHVFGFPLGLGKDDPVERTLQTSFKGVREKWLGMPDKANFAGGEAELFPQQSHHPITIRAASRIAMPGCGEDQSDMLRGSRVRRNRACYLIGESLDH